MASFPRTLAITAALFVVGCAPTPTRTIEVEMRDFSFAPAAITVVSGERMTLRFHNVGTADHEFMAGRDPRDDGGYKDDLFHGVDVRMLTGSSEGHAMSHGGFGLIVGAGRSGVVQFTTPSRPGTYEFGCFVVGHHELGMKGSFVIEPR